MKARSIATSLAGVLVTAISLGAFKFVSFGVDPFQSFMSGIDTLIPIDFGTLYVIVNAVLLILALVFDRHYIGILCLQLPSLQLPSECACSRLFQLKGICC